jgi:hypothetical protein
MKKGISPNITSNYGLIVIHYADCRLYAYYEHLLPVLEVSIGAYPLFSHK